MLPSQGSLFFLFPVVHYATVPLSKETQLNLGKVYSKNKRGSWSECVTKNKEIRFTFLDFYRSGPSCSNGGQCYPPDKSLSRDKYWANQVSQYAVKMDLPFGKRYPPFEQLEPG